MSELTIELTLSGQKYVLSREFVRTKLEGSLLADAIEMDIGATSIPLSNPVVTSNVMQSLVNLAEGREPSQHDAKLAEGYWYLNLPKLLIYADPFYDRVVACREDTKMLQAEAQRCAGTSSLLLYSAALYNSVIANHEKISALFNEAIQSNRDDFCAYFLDNGMVLNNNKDVFEFAPERNHLGMAIAAGANRVVRLFLRLSHLQLTHEHFSLALKSNNADIVQQLLNDPRADVKSYDHDWVMWSVSLRGNVDILKALIADGRVPFKSPRHTTLLHSAAGEGRLEMVKFLLTRPEVDPAENKNEALDYAACRGHADVVKVLLADPRVDPTDNNNAAIKTADRYEKLDVLKILLADRRVRSSLSKGTVKLLRQKLRNARLLSANK